AWPDVSGSRAGRHRRSVFTKCSCLSLRFTLKCPLGRGEFYAQVIAKVVHASVRLRGERGRGTAIRVLLAQAHCFDCAAHCFFHCFPLFLRRRLFSSSRKALHCNWRAFFIVDRLYFSKNFWTAPPTARRRGSGAGTRARCPRERRSRCPATPR